MSQQTTQQTEAPEVSVLEDSRSEGPETQSMEGKLKGGAPKFRVSDQYTFFVDSLLIVHLICTNHSIGRHSTP